MWIGDWLIDWLSPTLKGIGPHIPGEFFPAYFLLEYFHRPLVASFIVAILAGFLGTFLLIRNLALIGDGLAHVSFGGVALSIAFGIGMWFLFTFLWALVTSMVAFASGVNVGEINNQEMIRIEGFLDLLSPNGVFHHLLETNLADVDRGVPDVISWLSALFWTIIPWFWFKSRMSKIQP